MSAASVIENIDREKFEVLSVGIAKDGRWLLYSGSIEDMRACRWEEDAANVPAFLVPDRSVGGIIVLGEEGSSVLPVDCVFPVLHGANGEDGTMQGLLEIAGIPYVGSGVCASAAAMDKTVTKVICDAAGIPQAAFMLVHRAELTTGMEAVITGAERRIGAYPMFVKPASSGSSVGVSKASDRAALERALLVAAQYDDKVLIEEFIDGQELETAVLGNAAPIAPVVGEIAPCREFYSYEAKYIDGKSELFIPARISQDDARTLSDLAVRAYRALGCRGLARADFFRRRSDGKIIFNEINTLPGFTSISMYPKLMEAAGIPYKELITRLIALAQEV